MEYLFRFDEDDYMIIEVIEGQHGTGYYADIPDQIYFRHVADVPHGYTSRWCIKKINFKKAYYFVKKYVEHCHRKQRTNRNNTEAINNYLRAVSLLDYLKNDYDEERIKAYIEQEKIWKKEDKILEIHFDELNKAKIRHQQKIKKLQKQKEMEEKRRKQAERQLVTDQKLDIYTREWKQRLSEFLNSVMDGTYNPPETKYGYIGYGNDNISESYTEYCMYGGYTDYEIERM